MIRPRLKFKEDRRALTVMALALAALIGVLVVDFRPALLLSVPVLGCLCFICCAISHNQQHHPIFHVPILNALSDGWLTLCIGAPVTRLHLVHQLNHHAQFRGAGDWSRYSLAGEGRGPLRLMRYWWRATREMGRGRGKLAAGSRQRRALRRERLMLGAFVACGLCWNPASLLLIVGPAWLIGLYGLLTANLVNHDRCELADEWAHSRNFVSAWENFLLFNAGFHTAHHHFPSAHWTQLPRLHAERVGPHLPARATRASFFVYLFRHYVLAAEDRFDAPAGL